jgi:hypothetical protein
LRCRSGGQVSKNELAVIHYEMEWRDFLGALGRRKSAPMVEYSRDGRDMTKLAYNALVKKK